MFILAPSSYRLRYGIQKYLIPFYAHTFVPHCQSLLSYMLSPLVCLPGFVTVQLSSRYAYNFYLILVMISL